MAHMIEEGVDLVFTPQGETWEKTWHGLQTAVKGGIKRDGSNIEKAFCPIIELPVTVSAPKGMKITPEMKEQMSDWKMIVADCSKGESKNMQFLHVPKAGYKIHQNKALFDCMVKSATTVLGADGFEIVTVGTLGGYSQFFVSIAVKGEQTFNVGNLDGGKKDVWNKFFNLNSSHNGLIASSRHLSTIRMVCMNTVRFSVENAETAGTISDIKHTANSGELVTPKAFEADLKAWLDQSKAFEAALVRIKAEKMDVDQFKHYAAGLFTNEKSDNLSTHSYNRIEDMIPLFQRGMGNTGKTRYDGVNAVTEYFTHEANKDGDSTLPKRVAMANFGRGNDWKQDAITLATNDELFANAIKRGKTLYADKHAVQLAGN